MTALKGQEKTGTSIGLWELFKETDELKEQRGSHTSPPSLRPCKPQLALKNRTSLNCATRCLYHSVAEGDVCAVVAGQRGWLKDQSVAAEELLILLHHQCCSPAYKSSKQVVTVCSHDDATTGTGNEGAHTHLHTVGSTYTLTHRYRKCCKKKIDNLICHITK